MEQLKIENKYSLIQNKVDGGFDLTIDGRTCFCSFQTAMLNPAKAKLGVAEIVRLTSCNSRCPNFKVTQNKEQKLQVLITCGAGVSHIIENVGVVQEESAIIK